MTRRSALASCALAMVGWLGFAGCQLKRPDFPPNRMIEPQLATVPASGSTAPTAAAIRLLETQARTHIGRRLLHQRADGELIEDAVWRWSSAPDRYLDTALRLAFESSADIRLVDSMNVPVLAVTLLAWQLEGDNDTRLSAAIELRLTGTDRRVHTQLIRADEAVSGGLPGTLSIAAGHLLSRLASEASKHVVAETSVAPGKSSGGQFQ